MRRRNFRSLAFGFAELTPPQRMSYRMSVRLGAVGASG